MEYFLSKCEGNKKNIYDFKDEEYMSFKNEKKLLDYLKEKNQDIVNGYWINKKKEIIGCLGAKPTEKEMSNFLK